MSITLRQAIDRVLTRLSLSGGVDVQTYAEPVLVELINQKIRALFDKHWWDFYYNPGETFTLDGATGVVTSDLRTKIKRFQDIRNIWLDGYKTPLRKGSKGTNPMLAQRMFVPYNDAQKVFKVFPLDTTGDIIVAYKTLPDRVTRDEDIIELDEDLIVLGTAYDYLNGLGLNPGEEAKIGAMFEDRLKTVLDGETSHVISLGDEYNTPIVDTWYETN